MSAQTLTAPLHGVVDVVFVVRDVLVSVLVVVCVIVIVVGFVVVVLINDAHLDC